MAEGDTLVNALIGGIVSIIVSFVPFSPVLGGGVAGYLQGGDRSDGVRVGALAGVVALVPLVLLLLVFGTFGMFAMTGGMMAGMGGRAGVAGMGFGLAFLLVALVIGAVYTVGLSALGGWLGSYVKSDADFEV